MGARIEHSSVDGSNSAARLLPGHEPVMVAETVAALRPARGGIFVDATFGAGGYSRAMLDAGADTVIALDCDGSAIERGRAAFRDQAARIILVHANFCRIGTLLAEHAGRVQGIAFDLGVSSMQLDSAERGFSFRMAGPLDMRMGGDGPTAADLLNSLDEGELARILYEYGEEPAARRIARAVVREREQGPIRTTSQFAELVRASAWRPRGRFRIDPATRSFQAVRIAVNDELGRLALALPAAERLLATDGVLCVVTFHSLEDRVVKGFFARRCKSGGGNRHMPQAGTLPPSFRLLRRRCARPGTAEIARNPRSRSARMRAAERTPAPAFLPDTDGEAPWRRPGRGRRP